VLYATGEATLPLHLLMFHCAILKQSSSFLWWRRRFYSMFSGCSLYFLTVVSFLLFG
jgi:hypothetical protein